VTTTPNSIKSGKEEELQNQKLDKQQFFTMSFVDYDWIRLGLLFLVGFASFSEARIDYSNRGHNNILSQNSVKDAIVPASTFLLDWNQLKASAAATRDELYRMQRHTYMLSPMSYQHYNGGSAAQNIDSESSNINSASIQPSFQHQFSLFNPFALAQNEPVPTKNIQRNANVIPTNSLEFDSKSNPKMALNNQQRRPTKKVHMAVEPLLPSLSSSKTEPNNFPTFRSRKFHPKNTLIKHSGSNNFIHNALSKFKVYEAVPGDAF